MGPLSGKTSTTSKSSHTIMEYRLLTVLSCSSWFSDANGERPRPAYLPARISGYDARQVPFPDEYEEQEEPAGLQREEPTRVPQEESAAEQELEPAAEERGNTAEEVPPDELSDQDELDERTVELQLIDFTDEDKVEEPPEDDALDDDTGEHEPAEQPPQDEPAEELLPAEFTEEGFEESEEWLALADVAWPDEPNEEEPYYEYAAQYVEPFAGYRDLRGGDICSWPPL